MKVPQNILDRKGWERLEEEMLAPWAVKCSESRGRRYPEPSSGFRTCFQRDRDRIVHSMAFRRLEYKTQVFVNHEGDHYRTRLTHTLEVAQIARSIARILRLNVDLTEAIGLAHDIGHTPFGHAGEEELRTLMREHGGFEHNEHGLRVVDLLEQRHAEYPGLNLSFEVREGIIKHSSPYDSPRRGEFETTGGPSLEAQVVDIADEVAYNNHDLDDGLTARLLNWEQLEEVELWRKWRQHWEQIQPGISRRILKPRIVSSLINEQVQDVIRTSQDRIVNLSPQHSDEIRQNPEKLVRFSEEMETLNKQLKDFLMKELYRHYKVMRMTTKVRRFLKELFHLYVEHVEQMPYWYQQRMKEEVPERVVCDYLAGMTDRYALDEYQKLFIPWAKV